MSRTVATIDPNEWAQKRKVNYLVAIVHSHLEIRESEIPTGGDGEGKEDTSRT